jgi:hypothetical protein
MCCCLLLLLPVAAVLIAGGVALSYSQLSAAALSPAVAMLFSRCGRDWRGCVASACAPPAWLGFLERE